jgi:CRP-like cAMP-binding protein
MLDLSEDFGIADARGTLLGISISQADIASMVGASRPRTNEHLARMERDHILIPVGRRFIVITDKLRIRHPRQ